MSFLVYSIIVLDLFAAFLLREFIYEFQNNKADFSFRPDKNIILVRNPFNFCIFSRS